MSELKFRKALLLLDRGSVERGEDLLREVISTAQAEGSLVTRYRAMCCLGELLFRAGNLEEARRFLVQVESLESEDDQLDYERSVARSILSDIDKSAS